ncbi:hypothetical protein Bca4012_044073 [Brassica carinata]
MSKRSSSSIPTTANRARLKGRMESSVSRSDSSSEAGEGSDCDLMAPLPLSCVYAAPPLVGPASSVGEGELAEWRSRGTIHALIAGLCNLFEISPSQLNPPAWRILIAIQNLGNLVRETVFAMVFYVAGTHPAPSEGEKAVLRARQLPADRRQVNFLVSETVSRCGSLWRSGEGDVAKKGSSSRSASGDEEMITGSRRTPVVKLEPSPSLPGKRPKSGGVMTRSAEQSVDIARWHCLAYRRFLRGDPGSSRKASLDCFQLYHLGGRISDEGLLVLREEVEVLKRQVSGEKEQRVPQEFEIRDLKEKVKDLEKVAEASSADALSMNQKNQEVEEDIEALKAAAETFKFEMVMAVNGAMVVARWELMREWLRKQSAQWDLVTVWEQYMTVVQEETRNKGAPLPTFEDEPAIPPCSDMDVDSSVKPRGSPT